MADEFDEIEIVTLNDQGRKMLRVAGRTVSNVQDVSVKYSTEPLIEVTITVLTDDVKLVTRDGVDT